ncbi:hypothetical protein BLNAU_4214 [Blattamonas nauphoetae]|uniref:Uncharacterized protein n=1 Tax=Blattamonas nauphoetae TaxID=2049346 RepID=A0ABQ9YAR8_9EUKA|nr:hypothetical protein BLNAU_4214 [Blattamonas nauphoetae]
MVEPPFGTGLPMNGSFSVHDLTFHFVYSSITGPTVITALDECVVSAIQWYQPPQSSHIECEMQEVQTINLLTNKPSYHQSFPTKYRVNPRTGKFLDIIPTSPTASLDSTSPPLTRHILSNYWNSFYYVFSPYLQQNGDSPLNGSFSNLSHRTPSITVEPASPFSGMNSTTYTLIKPISPTHFEENLRKTFLQNSGQVFHGDEPTLNFTTSICQHQTIGTFSSSDNLPLRIQRCRDTQASFSIQYQNTAVPVYYLEKYLSLSLLDWKSKHVNGWTERDQEEQTNQQIKQFQAYCQTLLKQIQKELSQLLPSTSS